MTMNKRSGNRLLTLLAIALLCLIGLTLYKQSIPLSQWYLSELRTADNRSTTNTAITVASAAVQTTRLGEANGTEHQLTVLISSYKQPTCLKRLIRHLSKCTVVAAIHVNWFEPGEPPVLKEDSSSLFSKPIRFDKLPDRLSYRFYPRMFETEAVFHLDVDTTFSCEALELALNIFNQQESRYSAVGFDARNLYTNGTYRWDESYYPPHPLNTLFVTKGAITHRDVLIEYFSQEYRTMRDLVDTMITGEDMLMSFVLQHRFNTSIVFVCLQAGHNCERECQENNLKGLVSRTAHRRRDVLLKYFEHFGKILQNTSTTLLWQERHSGSQWKLTSNRQNCHPFVCGKERFDEEWNPA